MKAWINGEDINIGKLRLTKVINLSEDGWRLGQSLTDVYSDCWPCKMVLTHIFLGDDEKSAKTPGFNYDVGVEFLGEDLSRLLKAGVLEVI